MIKNLVINGCGYGLFKVLGIIYTLNKNKLLNFNEIINLYGTSSGALISLVICLTKFYDLNDIIEYLIEANFDNVRHSKTTLDWLLIYKKKGLCTSNDFKSYIIPLLKKVNISEEVTLSEFYNLTKKNVYIYLTLTNNDCGNFELIEVSHYTHPNLKLLDAIYGSCAIPLAMIPLVLDDKIYIDGGFVCNYPIEMCIKDNNIDECLGIRANRNVFNSNNKLSMNDNIIGFILKIIYKSLDKESFNDIKNTIIYDEDESGASNLFKAFSSKDFRDYFKEGNKIAELVIKSEKLNFNSKRYENKNLKIKRSISF